MDIGVLMLFQNHRNLPMADYDMYKQELDVCEMAEPLGFDSIWAVEHHFTDYTLCPNPIEMLSYLAVKRIRSSWVRVRLLSPGTKTLCALRPMWQCSTTSVTVVCCWV